MKVQHKCPFCTYRFKDKQKLYEHMKDNHEDDLQGLSPAHIYFN